MTKALVVQILIESWLEFHLARHHEEDISLLSSSVCWTESGPVELDDDHETAHLGGAGV
jgi:hypothetical protein